MLQLVDRAEAILAAADQTADTRAASGRYLRSRSFRSGVRYWASSRQRQREDLFGVQFHGSSGRAEALRLQAAFERAGLEVRNPETSKITFAQPIPYTPDGEIDAPAVRAVKATIDAILGGDPPAETTTQSFRDFMLASPWADVEIELPPRRLDPARGLDA